MSQGSFSLKESNAHGKRRELMPPVTSASFLSSVGCAMAYRREQRQPISSPSPSTSSC